MIQLKDPIRLQRRSVIDERSAIINFVRLEMHVAERYYKRYGSKRLIERCCRNRTSCSLCCHRRDPVVTRGDIMWIYELKQHLRIIDLPDLVHYGAADGILSNHGVAMFEFSVTSFGFAYQVPLGELW